MSDPEIDFVEIFHDSVWGSIHLTEIEQRIIKTDAFNRLRGIKQMSLAYNSFPGANHTRYEHSIGTMYVAYRMATAMKKSIKSFCRTKYRLILQTVRVAALLHDIGHPPFSHAIEEVFLKNPSLSPFKEYSHDVYTRKIIKENNALKKILEEYDISPETVSGILGDEKDSEKLEEDYKIVKPILNGDIDADKIDYIVRDNYYCGIPCELDLETFCNSLVLYKDAETKETRIYLKPEYLHAAETLLTARLRLRSVIHFAKENRITNQMLMRSVAGVLHLCKKKERKKVVEKLHKKWNDQDLYHWMKRFKDGNTKEKYYWKLYNKATRGDVINQNLEIRLRELDPTLLLSVFQLQREPSYLLKVQEYMEKQINRKLFVDFCFPHPPPLRMQIWEKDTEKKYWRYLFDVSFTIRGVLIDSFNKSSIYIYSDRKNISPTKLLRIFIEAIEEISNQYHQSLKSEKEITSTDMIMLVLYGLHEFEREKFPEKKLWAYATSHLHQYIWNLSEQLMEKKKINKVRYLEPYNPNEFNIAFYQEIEKLLYCGLIQQRKEVFDFDKDSTIFKFAGFRYDNRIDDTWGVSYVKKFLEHRWKDVLEIIKDNLFNLERIGWDEKKLKEYINKQLAAEKYDREKRKKYREEMREYREYLREKNYLRITP